MAPLKLRQTSSLIRSLEVLFSQGISVYFSTAHPYSSYPVCRNGVCGLIQFPRIWTYYHASSDRLMMRACMDRAQFPLRTQLPFQSARTGLAPSRP